MKNNTPAVFIKQTVRGFVKCAVQFLIACGCGWLVRLALRLSKKGFELYVSRALTFAAYVEKNPDNTIDYVGKCPRTLAYCLPQYGKERPSPMQFVDGYKGKYIAHLRDVTIIGGSNLVITSDGFGLNDMFAGDSTQHIRYNGRAFKMTVGNRKIISVVPHADIPKIERGIMLSANFSLNYYHFTFEVLPRFEFIDQLVPTDIPLIVDSNMVKYPQFREMLGYFNRSQRKLLVIRLEEAVMVGELYFPSIAPEIAPDIKKTQYSSPTDSLFDTAALDFVRQRMLSQKSGKTFPHKVFLYRPGGVRNFNQDEVFAVLEPLGFERIQTECLSAAEQVALFNEADVIVGGSGAALTNILYCKPGCKVLVVVRSTFQHVTAFSTIAAYVGANMQYVSAEIPLSDDSADFHADFWINPQRIKNLLNL